MIEILVMVVSSIGIVFVLAIAAPIETYSRPLFKEIK